MHRCGPRSALVATVVALAVLAGCTGGDDGDGAVPSSSSTTAPSRGCPAGDAVPPDGAEDVSEATADVDGNGTEDRVLAYRRRDGGRRVAVELAEGGTAAVDASASEIDGPAPLSALGGVDLGGDGDTVLAVTGAGASVVVVGLFQFDECTLTRVGFESGQEVELPVGGAITHGDGLRCSDGSLVRLGATSTDGETFTATDTRYRIDGGALVESGVETTTLTRGSDDEAINAYYTINCPDLENGLGAR